MNSTHFRGLQNSGIRPSVMIHQIMESPVSSVGPILFVIQIHIRIDINIYLAL